MSAVNLSDAEWSSVMLCLRRCAVEDEAACNTWAKAGSDRLAAQFRSQASAFQSLADKIEKAY